MPFAEALLRHLDITRITPDLLRFVAERTRDRELRKLLRPDNKDELAKWSWGRQAVDVVAEFARPGHGRRSGPTCSSACSRACTRSPPARWPTRTRSG